MNPKTSHFPNKYEATYVFSDTISRLFLTLAELVNIEELNKGTQLPYLFTDKPTRLTFTYTVGEITSLEYSKKLSWTIDNKSIPSFFTSILIFDPFVKTLLYLKYNGIDEGSSM